MNKELNFRTLQNEVEVWQNHNFPNTPTYRPLLGALEELGELAHAHLKMEQGIRGTSEEHFDKKVDAVADIIIFLAHYCNLSSIDLQNAIDITWDQVKQRDWQVDPENGGKNAETIK